MHCRAAYGKQRGRGMEQQEERSDRTSERRGQTGRASESESSWGMGECGPRIYSCSNCRCHVAQHDDIISKSFTGRNGRAYLFQNVVNVLVGPKEDRQLITGLHTVADIQCTECQEVLGWKYERAYDEAQKYKEGKYILEKAKVMKEDW